MRFTFVFAGAVVLITPTLAVTVSYDEAYDDAASSLEIVACSDGSNGLLTKGFTTFGFLPTFPNIGGATIVGGWNSQACGTCWELSYNGSSVNILVIDRTDGYDFNIAKEAMDELTGGRAEQLGWINAAVERRDLSACQL